MVVGAVTYNLYAPPAKAVAANDAYATIEDSTLNVAAPGVLGNDTDADGNALTAQIVTGPAHGALALNANGSFGYTPLANYNGSDSFTYRANDGTANSNIATVTITIGAVNDPPLAANDTAATAEDTPVAIAVLANDSDADGDPLTVSGVSVTSTDLAAGLGKAGRSGTFSSTPIAVIAACTSGGN